ncbi:hypothetical protein cand_017570 [Cryptosporidium andersoni]|uniref:Uncharacterized protein n=1 Tax=Cryptosporidium andersoni TaxID=117008 RepID=A0A1J4MIX0_9CRYT|nr:hypothetical protein cand_017570 [Cryptosporidium andersoni]
MSSDSEETWYSVEDLTSLADIYLNKILIYIPIESLSISSISRLRSWEYIDNLKLPLMELKYILQNPLSLMKKFSKVIIKQFDMTRLSDSLDLIASNKNILIKIQHIEIRLDTNLDNQESFEDLFKSFIILLNNYTNLKDDIKILTIKDNSISLISILRIIYDYFPNISRIELQDCEIYNFKSYSMNKIILNSVQELSCIRCDPIIIEHLPNLKIVDYEPSIPIELTSLNVFESKITPKVQVFNLRIPKKLSDIFCLQTFFENFPQIDNLVEFKIKGNWLSGKQKKSFTIHCNNSTRLQSNLDILKLNIKFPRLKKLVLESLYISLEILDIFSSMYRYLFNEAKNNMIDYCIYFEDGQSNIKSYNIRRYKLSSIEEESNILLRNTQDLYINDKCNNFGKTNINFSNEMINIYDNNGPSINLCDSNLDSSYSSSINMQPYLGINMWIIDSISEDSWPFENERKLINQGKFEILTLDNQLKEIQDESISDIFNLVIPISLIPNIVDPLKTIFIVSPTKLILSLGYDNLFYSGYILNIMWYYQTSLTDVSILPCYLPLDYFLKLSLFRIKSLKVTLLQDKDLKKDHLINLCQWIETHRSNLTNLHIRITGTSSKWVPKPTDIDRIITLWNKMCPKAKGQIEFQCCYTEHIFKNMNPSIYYMDSLEDSD